MAVRVRLGTARETTGLAKVTSVVVPILGALLAVTLIFEPTRGLFAHSTQKISLPPRVRAPTTSTTAIGSSSVTSAATTTVPAPTTTAPSPLHVAAPPAPSTPSRAVTSANGQLMLAGRKYQFVGVNAYEIATEWGVDPGCGSELTDSQLDQLFAGLPPNSMVRFWAFQGTMATNVHTKELDWGPIDRVFSVAAKYHQRLVPVLAGESGSCDSGHWADQPWYNGGFMDVFNSTGMTPVSYWNYMQAIVNRYKTSPALGMWEPMSEAEASTCPAQFQPSNCNGNQTCPNEQAAAQALRHFFDVVGGEIHGLDPNHLVEEGLLGSGQCGAVWTDYEYVGASPGIDVLSYHDYGNPTTPIPGDQWNGLRSRLTQASGLGKPLVIGEEGINAGSSCLSDVDRASDFAGDIRGQIAAGVSGVLLWDWVPAVGLPCVYDIAPGDPTLGVVASVSPG